MARKRPLIDFIKSLVADQLENNAGAIFVLAKNRLLELGCSNRAEILAFAKGKFDAAAKLWDIPWLPESIEVTIEQGIWVLVEKGFNLFADKVCAAPQGADGEVFGASENIPDEIFAEANDPTLPKE